MESLKGYRDAGVNRLSMGVQSMDDDILRRLGRIHTARDVIRDVQNAREAGFDNIISISCLQCQVAAWRLRL